MFDGHTGVGKATANRFYLAALHDVISLLFFLQREVHACAEVESVSRLSGATCAPSI